MSNEPVVLRIYQPLPPRLRDTLCQGPEGEPRQPEHFATRMVEADNGDYWYACEEHETNGY